MKIEDTEFAKFIRLANRFRQTAIVDDDFASMRDEFDHELQRLTRQLDVMIQRQATADMPQGWSREGMF